jgi:hypothetical protein
MQCRHTVADWHRYVDPAAAALPIFAACRLLTKEGEKAQDARGIACGYWGRQRECPLYEGPGGKIEPLPAASETGASPETPIVLDAVWPVRGPGAPDGLRILVTGLTLLSLVLLGLTIVLGLAVAGGHAGFTRFPLLAVVAASISMATHILARLVAWAGR